MRGSFGTTMAGIAVGTAIGATIVATRRASNKKHITAKKMKSGGAGMKRKAGHAMHTAAGFIDNIAYKMK